jgi:hypothetical protein
MAPSAAAPASADVNPRRPTSMVMGVSSFLVD